ncbi:MAG TPA: phosphoribosylformylglycinamidine synthase I [Candidatus Omnitrophota bacterium]|nr:phosphoribosylformylglycinamidine synthase I [Candidatus Omnitrophota bacterium]HPS21073.1 phosphoribosylformylglycinamidine synthase I [Candidatus Omnitrophota bacterium]
MNKVKTLILRTAGTNCDKETAHAFSQAGSEVTFLHINELIKERKYFQDHQILALPGGFTYGDDIASGKILANELRNALQDEIVEFVKSGKLVIGICNGFQILVKMGLLPNVAGKDMGDVEATLARNNSGKFEDRWIHLSKVVTKKDICVWTKGLPEVIFIPVAHGEGKFIPCDKSVLEALWKAGQVVFQYSDENGEAVDYPDNPNGSVDRIAGVCDPTGRILGLMPHPERHVSYLQHPFWQRLDKSDSSLGVGLQIFKNGVSYVKRSL